MITITASDIKMQKFINPWIEGCKLSNFVYKIYNLGGLDQFEKFIPEEDISKYKNGIRKCIFKPKVILHAMEQFNSDIFWLDIDAIIQKQIIEIPPNKEIDILVTKREEKEIIELKENGLLNAGVIFFKNSQKVKNFIKKWYIDSLKNGIEQIELINNIKSTKLNVKYLSTILYNNYYNDKSTINCFIRHYKGTTQQNKFKGVL